MYTVQSILRSKAAIVYTIDPGKSALDAARLMNEHRIGSLVVMENQQLAGIITERDILTRIVAAGRFPAQVPILEVMTTGVLTCSSETHLSEVRRLMSDRRIRHVPVVDGSRLVGMVSIGDLNKAQVLVLEQAVAQLETYIAS